MTASCYRPVKPARTKVSSATCNMCPEITQSSFSSVAWPAPNPCDHRHFWPSLQEWTRDLILILNPKSSQEWTRDFIQNLNSKPSQEWTRDLRGPAHIVCRTRIGPPFEKKLHKLLSTLRESLSTNGFLSAAGQMDSCCTAEGLYLTRLLAAQTRGVLPSMSGALTSAPASTSSWACPNLQSNGSNFQVRSCTHE